MRLRLLGATALAIGTASAFRDASPFFLFSTSELPISSSLGSNVASAQNVHSSVTKMLSGCPSDSYIIVEQPGVSFADFSADETRATRMSALMSGKNENVKTKMTVGNVIGQFAEELSMEIQSQCGASQVTFDGSDGQLQLSSSTPQVIRIQYKSVATPGSRISDSLGMHDAYLATVLAFLPSDKYTIIYTTSPPADAEYQQVESQEQLYEYDEPYPSGMHTDLKRDLLAHTRASNSSNLDSNLPLFEKYQFLNAGIFMGVSVSLLLLIILYVGISAIAGLEVSYAAFSKEMGPSAQKKQQQ